MREPIPSSSLYVFCRLMRETQTPGIFPPCEIILYLRKILLQSTPAFNSGSESCHQCSCILTYSSERPPRPGVPHVHRQVEKAAVGLGLSCTEKILKLKREAISPAWVQMRIQNITQDFQSMIHELEELWSRVFERGRKTVNPNPLVDSKQVSSWLQPGSIRAGKTFWFRMVGEKASVNIAFYVFLQKGAAHFTVRKQIFQFLRVDIW